MYHLGADNKHTLQLHLLREKMVPNQSCLHPRLFSTIEFHQIPGGEDYATTLVLPEDPTYPLDFEYREYARINGIEQYSRAKVFEVIKPTMPYARDILQAGLKMAARDLERKPTKDVAGYKARQHVGFYRHGQPSPVSTTGSKKGSKVGSRYGGNKSLNGQLGDIDISTTTHAPSAKSGVSDSSPRRPSKLPQLQSYPGPSATAAGMAAPAPPLPPPPSKTKSQAKKTTSAVSRKRRTSEMDFAEEDELNNTDTQGSSQSKRARTSQ